MVASSPSASGTWVLRSDRPDVGPSQRGGATLLAGYRNLPYLAKPFTYPNSIASLFPSSVVRVGSRGGGPAGPGTDLGAETAWSRSRASAPADGVGRWSSRSWSVAGGILRRTRTASSTVTPGPSLRVRLGPRSGHDFRAADRRADLERAHGSAATGSVGILARVRARLVRGRVDGDAGAEGLGGRGLTRGVLGNWHGQTGHHRSRARTGASAHSLILFCLSSVPLTID
jgi:hypothetical protein